MINTRIYIDFETRSRADLKKVGAWRYSEDKSTDVLCLAYSINYGYPKLWTPAQVSAPLELMQHVENGAEIHAWNAGFEYAIWNNVCVPRLHWTRVPFHSWRDTMAKSAAASYPLGLDNAAAAMGVKGKDTKGKRLITKLCKPRKGVFLEYDDCPQDFQDLYKYCQQDVQVEMDICRKLSDLTVKELKIWQHCLKMNTRGLPMDYLELSSVINATDKEVEGCSKAIVVLTKGEVQSPNQTVALKKWFNKHITPKGQAVPHRASILPDLTKASVKRMLSAKNLPVIPRKVLQLRQTASHSSIAKIKKALAMLCKDNTIKDLLVYHGAGTGRYAGRNFQLQNLPRGEIKIQDPDHILSLFISCRYKLLRMLLDIIPTASSLIRSFIKAPPGYKLIVADYHSIEAIATPWIAGETDLLEKLKLGLDLYIEMAARMFSIRYEMVGKDQRQAGKICILAAGFAGGYNALLGMAENYGIKMTESIAKNYISRFRSSRPLLVQCWYDFENAAFKALSRPKKNNGVVLVNPNTPRVMFYMEGSTLKMKLPSGRDISYPGAYLAYAKTPWGAQKMSMFYKAMVGNKWSSKFISGGNLFQNAVQGTCRDILCDAQLRLDDSGYPISISVHDECGSFVPDTPEYNLNTFISIMTDVPLWARGLPVTADGFESNRYRK